MASRADQTDTKRQPVLTLLADVKPEPVEWLWPGYLPKGKLATLDGDPGLGKSTLAVDMAATVTKGGTWPDGSTCSRVGDVLMLSAEDGLADTIRPRLDAAGADSTRIHAIEGIAAAEPSEDGQPMVLALTMGDVDVLETAITETAAALLIVDVFMAYLPTGTDSHRDQDIRRVLSRLSKLADRTACTVLMLRHLNKAAGRDPLYRGGGSIGIVGAARAGLLVAADPEDPDRRVLASVKSNLGPPPESLAYRLVDAGMHGVARVQWEGVTEHTARGLLAGPPADDDSHSALTEAEQWLTDYLTDYGDRGALSKDAKSAAGKEAGIRERTLQRASKSIGVVVESRGHPRVTWWRLPSGAQGPNPHPGPQNVGATGATSADQGKQIGATGQKTQSRQPNLLGTTGLMREPVNGPDRCPRCHFHVPKQGHDIDCPDFATETVHLAGRTTNGRNGTEVTSSW